MRARTKVFAIIAVFLALYTILTVSYSEPSRFSYPPLSGDISFFFNSSLRSAILNSSTLDVEVIWERVTEYGDVKILERQIFYTSEVIGGKPLRINAIFMMPLNASGVPVLVFQHGYGQRWADFYEAFRYMISLGRFAVFAIDAPDCGNSSRLISKDPRNLVSIESPYGSYLFHEAFAIMRGITYVTTLPEVNGSKIIMGGVSMGGIMTFIVSAVDDRVIGAVPIIASGNLLDTFGLPRLSHGMILASPEEAEEVKEKLLSWFDPIQYARVLDKPVLYMVATNDEYFSLIAANDTFNAIPSNDKRFVIFPNGDHMGIPWALNALRNVVRWVRHVAYGEYYPEPEVSLRVKASPLFTAVDISASAGLDGFIYFRGNTPTEDFYSIKMRPSGGELSATVYLFWSRRAAFFAAFKNGSDIVFTTPIFVVEAVPSAPLVALALLAAVVFLEAGKEIKSALKGADWRKVSSMLLVISSAVLSVTSPLFAILGRGSWSLFQMLEPYKVFVFYSFPGSLLLLAILSVLIVCLSETALVAFSIAVYAPSIALVVLLLGYELASGVSWSWVPVSPGWGLVAGISLLIAYWFVHPAGGRVTKRRSGISEETRTKTVLKALPGLSLLAPFVGILLAAGVVSSAGTDVLLTAYALQRATAYLSAAVALAGGSFAIYAVKEKDIVCAFASATYIASSALLAATLLTASLWSFAALVRAAVILFSAGSLAFLILRTIRLGGRLGGFALWLSFISAFPTVLAFALSPLQTIASLLASFFGGSESG